MSKFEENETVELYMDGITSPLIVEVVREMITEEDQEPMYEVEVVEAESPVFGEGEKTLARQSQLQR